VPTPDESLDRLLAHGPELLEWSGTGLNEADTRAKIIDCFFKDVLGWEESAIRREVLSGGGEYLDYYFESPTNRLVVEAKRAGQYFDMPRGAALRARRNGILARSPSLHQALNQVVGYCTAGHHPVGVVSNGLHSSYGGATPCRWRDPALRHTVVRRIRTY
jgi:hypothetical protein